MLYLLIVLPAWAIFAHFRGDHGKVVGLQSQTAIALLLLSMAIIAMGVISTALSTSLNFVGNLTISFFIFMLGLMSPYLFGLAAAEGNFIAGFIYAIVPNWQEFWMADPISVGKEIPSSYVSNCIVYFFNLVSIFVIAAILLFQEREVGCQNVR